MHIDRGARRSAGRGWAPVCAACALGLASAASTRSASGAEVKAAFITGTWATEEGCQKLAKIASGTPKSVETMPETLTQDGYATWEGGCTFSEIKETVPGRTWSVKTACVDGAEEWSDDETIVLDETGKRLTVTVEDKTTVFVRCESGKGN